MPTKIHPDVTPPKAPKYGAAKTVTFFSKKLPDPAMTKKSTLTREFK